MAKHDHACVEEVAAVASVISRVKGALLLIAAWHSRLTHAPEMLLREEKGQDGSIWRICISVSTDAVG